MKNDKLYEILTLSTCLWNSLNDKMGSTHEHFFCMLSDCTTCKLNSPALSWNNTLFEKSDWKLAI